MKKKYCPFSRYHSYTEVCVVGKQYTYENITNELIQRIHRRRKKCRVRIGL